MESSKRTILIAEDNRAIRMALVTSMRKLPYDCVQACNGAEAWELMRQPDAPKVALIDWQMPEMTGVEVIANIRELADENPPYCILLTALGEKKDIVAGLQAGANDYVIKPYDPDELRARVSVGQRMVDLQAALSKRVSELQKALDEIKTLRGIVPICASCKMIRDDGGYWQQVEEYVSSRTFADFSHSLCPACERKLYPEFFKDEETTME